MLNVLFAADFPIAKTGIVSTASSILAEDVFGPTTLFSEFPLLINGTPVNLVRELNNASVHLIFTHIEYSGLPALQHRFPEAIVHVGDWPLHHWSSILKKQPIKGALGTLRCHWRMLQVDRSTRLAFVTQEDCDGAKLHGFSRALHLPIGVKPPEDPQAEEIDLQSVCFSGNFRYQPNREAALRLLKLTQAQFPELRVFLVGFYAEDFKDYVGNMVEIHANVPSVIDFLAIHRPIYVSLIEAGAGAKNKILEAMVAGCPIICTSESLDSSISAGPSIKIVKSDKEVSAQLREWTFSGDQLLLTSESGRLADDTRANRSWNSVARMTRDLLTSLKEP